MHNESGVLQGYCFSGSGRLHVLSVCADWDPSLAKPATAYELTFSVVGPPLASDEYGSRNFTFEVYFQPDELPPELRQAISSRKQVRSDAAGRELQGPGPLQSPRRPIGLHHRQNRPQSGAGGAGSKQGCHSRHP